MAVNRLVLASRQHRARSGKFLAGAKKSAGPFTRFVSVRAKSKGIVARPRPVRRLLGKRPTRRSRMSTASVACARRPVECRRPETMRRIRSRLPLAAAIVVAGQLSTVLLAAVILCCHSRSFDHLAEAGVSCPVAHHGDGHTGGHSPACHWQQGQQEQQVRQGHHASDVAMWQTCSAPDPELRLLLGTVGFIPHQIAITVSSPETQRLAHFGEPVFDLAFCPPAPPPRT